MPHKYQPIIDIYQKNKPNNPKYTWSQAAHEAGFEGKWTADGKGGVKPRTGNRRGQYVKRSSFDQPSTEMAGYEAKRLKAESTRISNEAEMMGMEETSQVEHLSDQTDSKGMTSGAPGDPTNLKIVRQSEARFKDALKLKVGEKYAVTLNPTSESYRVVPQRFYDPIADPSTLPGIDVPFGADIDKVPGQLAEFNPSVKGSRGSISFQRGALTSAAAGGILLLGPLGTTASAFETAGRKQIADETGNPIDRLQQYISSFSLAADVASYAPPLTIPATVASSLADATNIGIDTTRGFINLFTRR